VLFGRFAVQVPTLGLGPVSRDVIGQMGRVFRTLVRLVKIGVQRLIAARGVIVEGLLLTKEAKTLYKGPNARALSRRKHAGPFTRDPRGRAVRA
jgi:hypothetical protein